MTIDVASGPCPARPWHDPCCVSGTARAVSQAWHVRLGVGPGLARRQDMPRLRRADSFF